MSLMSILLAGATLVGEPAHATIATPVRSDVADDRRGEGEQKSDEILVVGKSYGREVGKTVTPLKDTPNTVTVIERDQIEAQNLFTLEDALTATNGITVNGVGSEDPSFLSRGFVINNYLIDGVPTFSLNFPAVVPDLFFYDRLEVLRGPAGLFSGSGNPAGSINLVRKRPLDALRMQASAGYGSYDNARFELDVSTPVGSKAGIRVGAMLQDQDQFFDTAHRNRLGAFAVGSIEIGERTTLTVGGNYDRFRPAVQSGLPGIAGGADGSDGALLDIDRSTYLGADWNRFESKSWTGFAELTHKVSDRWTLRATGLFTDVDRVDIYSYIGNQPVTATNGSTNHIAYRGDSKQRTRSFDFNGIGSFPLFGRDQTLILGGDYQASSGTSFATRLSNYARIDVYNPVSPLEPPLDPYGPLPYYPVQGTGATCPTSGTAITPAPANCVLQVYGGSATDVEQYGLYGQMRLSPVAGLTLVGGGRLTWWDTTVTTLLTPNGALPAASRYGFDNRFTPYAGIVWDLTPALNIYGSYADSFTPQAAPVGRSRPDGRQIEPLTGKQFEAGTKLSLMHDRLLLSAAAYQITQSNRLYNDPDLPTSVLQIGKVRARGIETEVSGEIVPGWRINGGYSYTRTKYLEDANPLFEGISLVPIVPKHMAKMFTNYAPVAGPLAGLSLGGGLTWFGSTFGGTGAVFNTDGTVRTRSSIVRQGSYAVLDLRAGYALTPRLGVSVNVNNVLDRDYYARISSTGRGNYYGSPRTAFATLRYTFQ
ncbi:outer membrane receptor for ferric coprogen and ferric-rhodotorulic acid [Sphingomonas sp. PP-CE-3A-406]|uniref:TonB-dependent siderophore receptor n=1 Tax=Sphingomonas sp. PP-CE-3A-406 TaxID=2135659 RepID=UPI000EF8CD9C|nr:TonB-dependent receptor [Sphingomonas sp. PP-CE-3A-406]RMB55046.1 outer membrane receptor for ferric coprogen and ferric-rhodotorulic acid [Sphingomonas sp. PP-CE-3A-406]